MTHKIPDKPWETIGTDTFMLNHKNNVCIVGCNSKFSTVKQTEGLPDDHLIKSCKIIFAEYGLSKKIIYKASSSSVSQKTLQEAKDLSPCVIIIQSSKQWTSRTMH